MVVGVADREDGAIEITIEVAEFWSNEVGKSTRVSDLILYGGSATMSNSMDKAMVSNSVSF